MDGLTLEHLKTHSGLPGPRGNLKLLYSFILGAPEPLVDQCLAVLTDDTANSPEEFLGMCGVATWAVRRGRGGEGVLAHLRRYAVHPSWRIREAVAMALQEMAFPDLGARIDFTDVLQTDHPLVHRAIVAGLCEPKNLQGPTQAQERLFDQLDRSTALLAEAEKLSEAEVSLRKALGYGWSVAVVAFPEVGKSRLERHARSPRKHIRWIVAENLKKTRLERLDAGWVAGLRSRSIPRPTPGSPGNAEDADLD